jgi:hypothetical protein
MAQDATDEDAAMSMFRLRRMPTLAHLQQSGRVPIGVAELQV